jgi:ADP-ribosyl-[dinitrogen reductase] hydrolase
MEWHHLPIRDGEVPGAHFEQQWILAGEAIRNLLRSGMNVLVHCKGGLCRAGTIAARLLVEFGHSPASAIAMVRAARPGALETPDQEAWVATGRSIPEVLPARETLARRDRAVGALVGLAVGDALGTTLEFSAKPQFADLTEIVGGGPFRLAPGDWTDDTAMALALADSLQHEPALEPGDLMSRFLTWYRDGRYSCTGTCFDIGSTVRAALERFEQTGQPIAGSTDRFAAGNGALMRLAPVAIRHWSAPEECARIAALQTSTTHSAPEAISASVLFASMLAEAIAGQPRFVVLRARHGVFAGGVEAIAKGTWRSKHRTAIRGSGYCVAALEAAIWAVARTTSFRSAVLTAANLGEDADTTAAIAGQLAGALYGLSGIPEEWRKQITWGGRIEDAATALFVGS